MDELVLRCLQGLATPAEEARLLAWRRRDPANERHYRALAGVWELADEAAPEPGSREKPSFEALMARARSEAPAPIEGGRSGLRSGYRRGRRRFGGPLAAGLLAASLAGLALYAGMAAGAGEVASGPLLGEIVTGAGEMTTVTLADGTSIRLGPSSRLRMRGSGSDEVAELQGRAFFAVRSDSTRRFRVRTSSGEVIVHGTRFEVREEDEFRVLVVDGSVRVAAAGASVELGEATMGRLSPGGSLATTEVDDVYAQLAWMGNALVFQNTPLPRALDEIERRLAIDVVLVGGASLEDLTVTATFTDQTVEEVILVLCGTLGAECFVDEGRAVIAAPAHAPPPPDP